MKVLVYSITAFVILTFAFACSKASLVGSELFIPDSIDLLFRDDFEINAKTVTIDSVNTYDGTVSISSLIVGELSDPSFGKTEAEAFVSLVRGSALVPNFIYTLNGAPTKVNIDSVVLVMEYNDGGFYGDSTARHSMEVRIVDEEISREDSIFSNFRPSSSQLIGSKSFVPAPNDSLFILNPGETIASGRTNQMRVRLDNSWAQAMVDDTSIISTAENFLDYAPAVHISSTPDASSTMGFLFGTKADGTAADNSIYVYYSDTIARSYRFVMAGVRHNYYGHDYSDGTVSEFLDDEEKGDELLFLQGMAGVEVDLEVPLLANGELDDFVINKVELEFFVQEDATIGIHDPIERIILQYYDNDGELVIIQDAFLSFDSSIESFFEGNLTTGVVDGVTIKKYNAVLSIHAIQEMKDNDNNTTLRITPRNKTTTPNRSIIYGPGHSQYPMKLKVNYSK